MTVPSRRTCPLSLFAGFAALLAIASGACGGSVRTFDGKTVEGELRFTDTGALLVHSEPGDSVSLELTNIACATFAPGIFLSSGSLLPNGWAVQDIGETRGFTRLEGDSFASRVEGHSTNATACHFAGRTMHSDGEIVARVEQVGGTGEGRAGLIMRAHNGTVFAALSCDGNGKVWFERKPDPDRRDIRSTVVRAIAPPIWLRLQKRDKIVAASCSTDGRLWETMSEPVKFSAERMWREGEGELHLLRASFGLFASSRGRDTVCTARVAQVAMTLHGLLGEYFSGQKFQDFRFARLDPQLRFNWGLASPDPALDKDDFSVRWTGQIVPWKSGSYEFFFDADDRARLWIDGEEKPQVSFKKPDARSGQPASAPRTPSLVPLVAGKPVEVKMEFSDGEGVAGVKLGWAHPGQTPEVIGMTNFVFSFAATNSPERTATAAPSNDVPVIRGVLLRDGTFIAGTVASANESAVRISFGGRKDVPVLNSRVARIVLRPPRQSLPYEIAAGRTGVFLRNRDFLECDFRGIEWGSLSTSSVLFGLRRFAIEAGEVLVVMLNDCKHEATEREVRLLDGSIFRASKLSASERSVTIEEPLLGRLSIPVSELFQIRCAPGTLASAAAKPVAHPE